MIFCAPGVTGHFLYATSLAIQSQSTLTCKGERAASALCSSLSLDGKERTVGGTLGFPVSMPSDPRPMPSVPGAWGTLGFPTMGNSDFPGDGELWSSWSLFAF